MSLMLLQKEVVRSHLKHRLKRLLVVFAWTCFSFSLVVVPPSLNDLKFNIAFTYGTQSTLHLQRLSLSFTSVCRHWRQVDEVSCLRTPRQYAPAPYQWQDSSQPRKHTDPYHQTSGVRGSVALLFHRLFYCTSSLILPRNRTHSFGLDTPSLIQTPTIRNGPISELDL